METLLQRSKKVEKAKLAEGGRRVAFCCARERAAWFAPVLKVSLAACFLLRLRKQWRG
jgi:hypothetical protein